MSAPVGKNESVVCIWIYEQVPSANTIAGNPDNPVFKLVRGSNYRKILQLLLPNSCRTYFSSYIAGFGDGWSDEQCVKEKPGSLSVEIAGRNPPMKELFKEEKTLQLGSWRKTILCEEKKPKRDPRWCEQFIWRRCDIIYASARYVFEWLFYGMKTSLKTKGIDHHFKKISIQNCVNPEEKRESFQSARKRSVLLRKECGS